MKQYIFLISTIFLINFSSCKSDDDLHTDPIDEPIYHELSIVTGLDFFDDNGSSIGRWKSPNHNPGDIATYPIPCNGNFFASSPIKIIRIWLIPTDCVTDAITFDIPTLSENINYGIAELEDAQVKDISLMAAASTQLAFDFTDIAAGFYKVFYQLEPGEIFWQNIYIDPSATNFPTFDFLDNLCD